MFTSLHSTGVFGIDAYMVEVEADISNSFPAFEIVGLPDAAVKESRDRVRSALKNSGFKFPTTRITVNLAPADIKKVGSMYDLPSLVAILNSSGQLMAAGDLDECAFIGELSLDGELRHINGVLSMAIEAAKCGIKKFFVPLRVQFQRLLITAHITMVRAAAAAAAAVTVTTFAFRTVCITVDTI